MSRSRLKFASWLIAYHPVFLAQLRLLHEDYTPSLKAIKADRKTLELQNEFFKATHDGKTIGQ